MIIKKQKVKIQKKSLFEFLLFIFLQNNEQKVKVSDTTGDAITTAVGNKKITSKITCQTSPARQACLR